MLAEVKRAKLTKTTARPQFLIKCVVSVGGLGSQHPSRVSPANCTRSVSGAAHSRQPHESSRLGSSQKDDVRPTSGFAIHFNQPGCLQCGEAARFSGTIDPEWHELSVAQCHS